jgi:hypothetical protein
MLGIHNEHILFIELFISEDAISGYFSEGLLRTNPYRTLTNVALTLSGLRINVPDRKLSFLMIVVSVP